MIKIDEYKNMALYQTNANNYMLDVNGKCYNFSSLVMAQYLFNIVKELWLE